MKGLTLNSIHGDHVLTSMNISRFRCRTRKHQTQTKPNKGQSAPQSLLDQAPCACSPLLLLYVRWGSACGSGCVCGCVLLRLAPSLLAAALSLSFSLSLARSLARSSLQTSTASSHVVDAPPPLCASSRVCPSSHTPHGNRPPASGQAVRLATQQSSPQVVPQEGTRRPARSRPPTAAGPRLLTAAQSIPAPPAGHWPSSP